MHDGESIYTGLIRAQELIVIKDSAAISLGILRRQIVQLTFIYMRRYSGIIGDLVAMGIILRHIIEGILPEVLCNLIVLRALPFVFHEAVGLNRRSSIFIIHSPIQRQVHIRALLGHNTCLVQPQQIECHILGMLERIGDDLLANHFTSCIQLKRQIRFL